MAVPKIQAQHGAVEVSPMTALKLRTKKALENEFFRAAVGAGAVLAFLLLAAIDATMCMLVYSAMFFGIWLVRWYLYYATGLHCFLMDFCYAANCLCIAYLFLLGEDARTSVFVFAVINGPLAMATVFWPNALVVSSFDKLCSSFVHMAAPVVMYVVRWEDEDSLPGYARCDDGCPDKVSMWGQFFVWPVAFYCTWQFLYWVAVQIMMRKSIKENDFETSFTWLIKKTPKTAATYKFVHILGHRYRHVLFGVSQLIYTMITLAMPPLLYFSRTLHSFFMVWLLVSAIWSAMTFYAKRQQKLLAAAKTQMAFEARLAAPAS